MDPSLIMMSILPSKQRLYVFMGTLLISVTDEIFMGLVPPGHLGGGVSVGFTIFRLIYSIHVVIEGNYPSSVTPK